MKKLLVACALLAVGATACPAPPTPVDWAACPAAASGQVQVAVVVEGGSDPAKEVVCVVVPAGSNSLDALSARATRIGAPAPRIDAAFLCGIDGIPAAPSCGDSGPAGFTYWNFWTGGAAWESASIGGAGRVVTQGSVDGWVFGTWDFATTFPQAPAYGSTFASLTS